MSHFLITNTVQSSCAPCSQDHLQRLLLEIDRQATVETAPSVSAIGLGSSLAPALHVIRLDHWTDDLAQELALFQAQWPHTPTLAIFCSRQDTHSDIIMGLDAGLDDYVACPVTSKGLIPRLQRLLSRSLRQDNHSSELASQERMTAALMVGRSPQFTTVTRQIPLLAKTDSTVLITGETGTGKELVARAIHYRSTRCRHPFIALNCSAVPDVLFENELFGHTRGAYTDAGQTEPGLIEEAEGGTLFLDEIDSLSRSAQAKLLRFIQHREYRPLGSSRLRHANVRLLAATNADLRQRMREREFREDLFHRINVMAVTLPPLRQRASDIPLLVRHILSQYQTEWDGQERRLSPGAMDLLIRYAWPGNIRELESVLHRAVMTAPDPLISEEWLDLPTGQAAGRVAFPTLQEAKRQAADDCEKSYVITLLTACSGNISQAARQARIDRRALQRIIQKHQVDRQIFQFTGDSEFPVMPESQIEWGAGFSSTPPPPPAPPA